MYTIYFRDHTQIKGLTHILDVRKHVINEYKYSHRRVKAVMKNGINITGTALSGLPINN